MAMSSVEARFSQVSVMKTASGMSFEIVFQISEVCLPSEHALIRMQWSSVPASAVVSVGGVGMVVLAVILESDGRCGVAGEVTSSAGVGTTGVSR